MSLKLLRSSFIRAMALIMSGAIAGQLIGIASTPVISRLYTPEQFGLFSQFAALLTITSVISTLRLEDALLVPRNNRATLALARSAIISAFFTSCLILCILALSYCLGITHALSNILWLLPPSVLLIAVTQTANAWKTKRGAYYSVARVHVGRSSIAALAKIALGGAGYGGTGLALGQAIGDAVAAISHRQFWAFLLHAPSATRHRVSLAIARQYSDFAIYGTTQILLGALWIQLPTIFIGQYYGAAAAGSYGMAMIAIQYPMAMLQSSLRQVFYPKIMHLYQLRELLLGPTTKVMAAMYAIYLVPALAIAIFGATAFRVVLGTSWDIAGQIAQILVVSSFLSIAKTPAIALARLYRKQRQLVVLDIVALGLELWLFLSFAPRLTLFEAITLHACIMAAYNLVQISWMLYLTHRHDKDLRNENIKGA